MTGTSRKRRACDRGCSRRTARRPRWSARRRPRRPRRAPARRPARSPELVIAFGAQRVASEEVDLPQALEQAGARVAAGRALELGDGQVLVGVDPIGEEHPDAIVMARYDQDVAADALATGGGEPIAAAALDQLDEAVAVGRQGATERVGLVGRVHRDGADRGRRRGSNPCGDVPGAPGQQCNEGNAKTHGGSGRGGPSRIEARARRVASSACSGAW